MPIVDFPAARTMTTAFDTWLKKVSEYIKNPSNPLPTDIYNTQKLAFEIDKAELTNLLTSNRVIGIMGYEAATNSVTIIFVGTDAAGKPKTADKTHQTWPVLKKMDKLSEVLSIYLTP